MPTPAELELVRRAHRLLVTEIEPHEQAEDRQLYPAIAEALGGTDPTGTMSRTHAEIARLTARTGMILDGIDHGTPSADDIIELRRLLYGLHAILELHFAQEEESYLSLAQEHRPTTATTTPDSRTPTLKCQAPDGGRGHGAQEPGPRPATVKSCRGRSGDRSLAMTTSPSPRSWCQSSGRCRRLVLWSARHARRRQDSASCSCSFYQYNLMEQRCRRWGSLTALRLR